MQRSPTRRGEERAHPYGTRLLPGEVGIWLKHSAVSRLGPWSHILSLDCSILSREIRALPGMMQALKPNSDCWRV